MANAATIKQIEFINRLKSERILSDEQKDLIPTTSFEASLFISILLDAPKRATGQMAEMQNALRLVPTGRYAIPADVVAEVIPNGRAALKGNDHLFVRIYNYKNRVYMVRLQGSVGDFATSRMPVSTVISLARLLQGRAQEFTQLFGQLFRVCGRCAAPLTDPVSRELSLGPDCRQVFGL